MRDTTEESQEQGETQVTQENAEKLMESLIGLSGGDMNTHSWECQARGVKFEAVEILPEVWAVVVYYYDVLRESPQWVRHGVIHSFCAF